MYIQKDLVNYIVEKWNENLTLNYAVSPERSSALEDPTEV